MHTTHRIWRDARADQRGAMPLEEGSTMARGGARNRSGPQPDPSSGRSDRRGLKFSALPAEGYAGAAPEWPMPNQSDRESELWAWAWSTPQACAWAQPSESWRLHTIAMWVRTAAVCEGDEATAADKGSLHRFADQIGMTPAGLKENGWAVAVDEVGARAADRPAAESTPRPARRLRSADAQ